MDTIILKHTCKCNVTRIATKDCEEGGRDSLCGVIKTYSIQQSRFRGPGEGGHRAARQDREQKQTHSLLSVGGQMALSASGTGCEVHMAPMSHYLNLTLYKKS